MLAHPEPRGAPVSSVRPRPRTPSRVLAPRERWCGARVDGAACPSSECRASAPAPAVSAVRARRPRSECRARRTSAALSSAVPCSSSECGRARRPSAAVAAVVCPRRPSRVPASIEPSPCARVESAAVPVVRVRRCGARAERAAVLALRVPRLCARVDGAAAPEPRVPRGVPPPSVPPCLRRGSGTLVPWAPCPNGGRAFAERAALIVRHR